MIGRLILWWALLCGSFFFGWLACNRFHKAECEEDRDWLVDIIGQRDQEIDALKRQRERESP